MSKHRVAVLKVVSSQLSVTAAAAEYGISRQHLQRLLRRYREGGLEALEPRSRRPRTSPADAGRGARRGSCAARRAHRAGPRRRPGHHRLAPRARGPRGPSTRPSGGSCTRRAWSCPSRASARAARGTASRPPAPNELWQSDFTHWRLADGSGVEVFCWLDDHFRYLLACGAFGRVSGDEGKWEAEMVAEKRAEGDEVRSGGGSTSSSETKTPPGPRSAHPTKAYAALPKGPACRAWHPGLFRLRYDLIESAAGHDAPGRPHASPEGRRRPRP